MHLSPGNHQTIGQCRSNTDDGCKGLPYTGCDIYIAVLLHWFPPAFPSCFNPSKGRVGLRSEYIPLKKKNIQALDWSQNGSFPLRLHFYLSSTIRNPSFVLLTMFKRWYFHCCFINLLMTQISLKLPGQDPNKHVQNDNFFICNSILLLWYCTFKGCQIIH